MQIQRSLRKAMQNPEAVTGLDLRQTKPTILFPEIERFVNLEFIDLSNCTALNWADACTKLSTLPKLTEIKAFGAGITVLPTEFGLLTSLKKIDFSSNAALSALPDSFHALTSLEYINFHSCGLIELPHTTWNFPHLTTLTLSHNKLASFPPSFFEGMPLLENLFIDDNQLLELPESTGHLKALHILYAGCNPLQSLPESFSELTGLTTLWLDTCPTLDFEKELQKLKYLPLKELSILGNNLSVLPAAMQDLISLEVLNINSNAFGNIWNILRTLSPLPLKKLDIRFMSPDYITLEQVHDILPLLTEITSDPRSTEQYQADISTWVTSQLSA